MTLDLAKLRAETLALIHGTTPGPWTSSDKGTPGHFWIEPEAGYLPPPHYLCVGGAVSEANARLIAAAPTLAADTLRLLDEIERLTAENERMRERQSELDRALDQINSHPDLYRALAVFYDHWGLDSYSTPHFVEAGVRNLIGWLLGHATARAALAEGGPDDR